jgi:hypothetical protein
MNPTDQAEAEPVIPQDTVISSPDMTVSNNTNMNRTAAIVRRKAATRTRPWDQAVGELLVSQDEDNPARKKPRLEEPLPTIQQMKLLERLLHLTFR